jgi:hypothetical protein
MWSKDELRQRVARVGRPAGPAAERWQSFLRDLAAAFRQEVPICAAEGLTEPPEGLDREATVAHLRASAAERQRAGSMAPTFSGLVERSDFKVVFSTPNRFAGARARSALARARQAIVERLDPALLTRADGELGVAVRLAMEPGGTERALGSGQEADGRPPRSRRARR